MNKSRAFFAFQELSDFYPQRHVTFLIALMTFPFLAAYFMFYAIPHEHSAPLQFSRPVPVLRTAFIPFTYCLHSFPVLFVDLSPTAFLE